MQISYKWLNSMVELPDDIPYLSDRLDLTGTGVEGVEKVGAAFTGVVVGHVLAKEAHPDADTLWVTTIDVGENHLDDNGTPAPLQIVCGAQNFNAGDKVPVALIGAVLPDGTKIRKSKLRGITSFGMNCSGRELGISEDHMGLLILPEDAPVGQDFAAYLGKSDYVYDLEITPNRPDCMSAVGLARECGAIFDEDVDYEPRTLVGPDETPGPRQAITTAEDVNGLVKVTIADDERCPRYTARLIRNVKIGPSPEWLVERLASCGARSINNVVDVTNYVLFGLGQPLHAFDYDKLARDADGRVHIIVRPATDDEPFTTLDGTARHLQPDMTVIADGNAGGTDGTPVCLAGVMGGLDSEVTDQTVNVLLESAAFSPAHTSRTSRNLQLFSESSLRYERRVDDAGCADNSAAAAQLLAEVCGGEVVGGIVDVYPKPTERPVLVFRPNRFCRFVGADVPRADAIHILERLGCEIRPLDAADAFKGVADHIKAKLEKKTDGFDADSFIVVAPTFRPDLTREIDLYEEVLRLWGMDKVVETLPGGRERIGGRTEEQVRVDQIGQVLRACGLNETMTYSFCPADDQDKLGASTTPNTEAVQIINPMSSEQDVLRRDLLPGLLRSVAYNQSHGVEDIQLYETGRVFFAAEGRKKPKEDKRVAGVLAGTWHPQGWNDPARPLDFFDAKGIVENLVRELAIPKLTFKELDADAAPWLQPGRAAQVLSGGAVLGWVGEVHPRACAAFDVKPAVAAFELELNALVKAACLARPYVDVPMYPSVEHDLAIVVDKSLPAKRVEQMIQSAGGKLLDSVRLFDVFEDEKKLGADKKSLAFSLSYRAKGRTLTSEEVDRQHEHIVAKVTRATGGAVRS